MLIHVGAKSTQNTEPEVEQYPWNIFRGGGTVSF